MSNSTTPRIFYFGMANTVAYSKYVNASLHVSAASAKMLAIVQAVRGAGIRAYLLSAPVLGAHSHVRYVGASILRDEGCPQIFLPTVSNPYARKFIALLCFGFFCLRKVRKSDRVILFNHAFEYLLGLLILAARGNRAFLDIEDAARDDDSGLMGVVRLFLFIVFMFFSRSGKIIVSQKLAARLGLRRYCVVYGAIGNGLGPRDRALRPTWSSFCGCNPLRIHFGGSLSVDTGVELFCRAVELLMDTPGEIGSQVEFIVTGFGSEEKIRDLQRRCANSAVRISFSPSMERSMFLDTLCSCHVGLSLKIPESPMSMTTFPSKVVEIAYQGLLLISTKASDVPLLFDQNNSVLLADASPELLAKAIRAVLLDPVGMAAIASRGKERAFELFDSRCVGEFVVNFLLDDNG
jgi:hypothetical protein